MARRDGQIVAIARRFGNRGRAVLVLPEAAEDQPGVFAQIERMLELDRKFLVLDRAARLVARETRCRAVELDLIFGFKHVFVELRQPKFQAGFAERPAVRDLAVDAVIVLIDLGDIGVVDGQIARRRGADRPVDRSQIIIFKAALVFDPVGVNVKAVDRKIGRVALDVIGRVERIILAIPGIDLVLAIVEYGNIGRIAVGIFLIDVAQREFLFGIVPTLEIGAEQETARTKRPADDAADAGFELLVVEIEAAGAQVSAIEFIPIAQFDIQRARHRIARPTRRR